MARAQREAPPASGWRDGLHRHAWTLWGAGLTLLLLVMLGVLTSWLMPRLERPLGRFEIYHRSEHLSEAEVRNLLRPWLGRPLLDLPLAQLQQRLEAEPWIRNVRLTKRWPVGLEVRLEEEVPVARWGERGLLNPEGVVFSPQLASRYPGLPRLEGPAPATREMMERYYLFSQQLRPLGLKLTAMRLEARGAWTLELDNGIRLRVGRDPVLGKMQRFVRLYPRYLAPRAAEIQQVDIRYTNGLAVGWRNQGDEQVTIDRT